jgi:hypothetical protein
MVYCVPSQSDNLSYQQLGSRSSNHLCPIKSIIVHELSLIQPVNLINNQQLPSYYILLLPFPIIALMCAYYCDHTTTHLRRVCLVIVVMYICPILANLMDSCLLALSYNSQIH